MNGPFSYKGKDELVEMSTGRRDLSPLHFINNILCCRVVMSLGVSFDESKICEGIRRMAVPLHVMEEVFSFMVEASSGIYIDHGVVTNLHCKTKDKTFIQFMGETE